MSQEASEHNEVDGMKRGVNHRVLHFFENNYAKVSLVSPILVGKEVPAVSMGSS